jgi:hypothetical protein
VAQLAQLEGARVVMLFDTVGLDARVPTDLAAACVAEGHVVAMALDAEQSVCEVFEREPVTGLYGCPRCWRVIHSQRVVSCASCATRRAPGLELACPCRQPLPPRRVAALGGAGLWCACGSAVGTTGLAG